MGVTRVTVARTRSGQRRPLRLPQSDRSVPSETWGAPFFRWPDLHHLVDAVRFFNDDFNVNIRVVSRESIPYSDLTFVLWKVNASGYPSNAWKATEEPSSRLRLKSQQMERLSHA